MAELPTASTWFPTVDGIPGKSAYEIAVDEGFLGSEAQWLATLVGPQGATGPTGATGATGAPGNDGVVQSIVAGTGILVDNTDPANPVVSTAGGGGGGGGVGIAGFLASGDIYLLNDMSMIWGTSTITTTITRFQMAYVDAEITSTGPAVVVVGSPGGSLDISLYNFLGAGKPGTPVATSVIGSTPVGLVTGTWSGGNKVIPAGLYFVTIRSGGSNTTISDFSSTSEAPANELMLLTSDGFATTVAGSTEAQAVTVADANLPGGSWSSGMDLTGLDMTSLNTTLVQELAKIGIVKA